MKSCRFDYFRNLMLACMGVALLGLFGCAAEQPLEKKEAKEPAELVWPSAPEQPRIRFLAEYRGQSDFGAKKKKSWLDDEAPASTLQLEKPYGIAASDDGNLIYVSDTKKHAIVIFDFKANEARLLETDGRGSLSSPMEIALDRQGRIFVADSVRKEVLVYSADGKTLLTFGKKEELGRPTGIAIDEARNHVYVADTIKHRIVVYDLGGQHLFSFGERGSDPGYLNYPVNLTVDHKGRLLVTDSGNFRVQVFDHQGKSIQSFGQLGDSLGNFSRPKGLSVDSDNNIYVLDGAFNNFQIFNPEGRLLLFVGAMGREPGMFWLPTGIFINRGDRIYVADSVNARIQIFQYLKENTGTAAKEGAGTAIKEGVNAVAK